MSDRPASERTAMHHREKHNINRPFGWPKIALAATALLACGQASAALLSIGSGSSITTVGSGASRNNVLGSGVKLWDNASLATTAPAVLKFFYLGSESGLKNTLKLDGGPSHTDTDKIPGWAAATPLFEITIDTAGPVPMSFTSSKTGWGTITPGGASGGKSIAFAYLSSLTCPVSAGCVSKIPSNMVLFALDDGGGSPDDNDFDDYVGYVVATSMEKPVTTSAIPAVPLPAAFWLLGSALLGLFGIGRRRPS
jgi:hypothetical protein